MNYLPPKWKQQNCWRWLIFVNQPQSWESYGCCKRVEWHEWSEAQTSETEQSEVIMDEVLKKNTNIYLVYINLANSKTNILHFHANTYYLFVKKLILKPLSSLKSTMLSIFKWFVNDLLSPKLRWIALVVLIYELGAHLLLL